MNLGSFALIFVAVVVTLVVVGVIRHIKKKKKEKQAASEVAQAKKRKEEDYDMGEFDGQIRDEDKKFDLLQNLRRGQSLKIWGKGDLTVKFIHGYSDSDGDWKEYVLLSSDRKEYYFEAGLNDEGLIEVTISQKKKLRQVIDKDALEKIWDKERGSFVYEGKTYEYDDDYKVRFRPDPASSLKAEDFELIEFECDDDGSFITFEAYEEDDDEYTYEVAIGQSLQLDEITVDVFVG